MKYSMNSNVRFAIHVHLYYLHFRNAHVNFKCECVYLLGVPKLRSFFYTPQFIKEDLNILYYDIL